MSDQPPADEVEVMQGPPEETTEPLADVCRQLPEAMEEIVKLVVVVWLIEALVMEAVPRNAVPERLREVKVAFVPEARLNNDNPDT